MMEESEMTSGFGHTEMRLAELIDFIHSTVRLSVSIASRMKEK